MSATYSIESVATHAEPDENGHLVQWAELKIIIPKDFDFDKGSAKLLKQIQFAVSLIGRGDA
jgi:hypothetical protein